MGLFKREIDYYDGKLRGKECKKWFDKAFKLISPLPIDEVEEIKLKRSIPKSKENIKRNEEAIRFLDKALEYYSEGNVKITKNRIYSLKASILFLLGRYNKAIDIYSNIIYSEKNDEEIIRDAYYGKSGLLIKAKRYKEALIFCDKSIIKYQNNFIILGFKAMALYKLQKYEDAIMLSDQTLEINSNAMNAWKSKILSLYKLGRYESALRCIEDCSKTDCGNILDLEEIKEKIKNET